MNFFNESAAWITLDDGVLKSNAAGRFMLFRKRFSGNGELKIAISADSEYRLFCNGVEVAQGPACGDDIETFYDEIDLTHHLKEGENELLAEVVGFAIAFPDFYRGGVPMARMALRDCFILDGTLIRHDGSREFIGTNNQWEAAECPYLSLFRCPGVPVAGPAEKCIGNIKMQAIFFPAQMIEYGFRHDNVKNSMLYYRLTPRKIPFLKRGIEKFKLFFDLKNIEVAQLENMLQGERLVIAPNSKIDFSLDMGYETTARIILEFFRGKAQVELRYTETFFFGKERHFSPELAHDEITGPMIDKVRSDAGEWIWKPFFYRAFRFVRVLVETDDETCEIRLNSAERETYPFTTKGSFQSNDSVLNQLWETGYRTLELCSHNIFEDCPYYERVQYTADSRIAAKVAIMTSGDTALAEQAIAHFRHSIRTNGLTAGSYPSRSPVYLPLWSLHYVAMVFEVYQYTNKIHLLQENFSAIRRVLEFFLGYRTENGGIGKLPYWCMADFSKDWLWLGEPPDIDKKASAYATFFVAECLKIYKSIAVRLEEKFDSQWAEKIYNELCDESTIFYNSNQKMYTDTPGGDSFSLLTNAQAILAGISNDKQLMRRCYKAAEIKTASFFGKNFIFEAMLRSGDLPLAEELLNEWRALLIPGRTVFPEGTPIPRSECHVWTALPTIGLISLYAGFKMLNDGGTKISFAPYNLKKISCRGSIPLKNGIVEFDFSNNSCKVKLPKGITLIQENCSKISIVERKTDKFSRLLAGVSNVIEFGS